MNYKENMQASKLIEHPKNKKLFKDIKETNPTLWAEFVDSIRQDGIIEPLIVNKNTMQVRSGNQRLKAAIEIGLEIVPVLLIEETTTDDEIRKMISSNVFRRTIDPFAMFEYIGRLRKSSLEKKKTPITEIAKKLHKSTDFVCATDIINAMPEEQQEALKEWFNEQAEGEKAKSEGELIAMIKNMEVNQNTLEEELKDKEEKLQQIRYDKDELQEEKEKVSELISGYELDIKEKEGEIRDLEELKDVNLEEELDSRDAEINKLLEGQRKLKEKIKELKETPDINVYLIDSVKKLLDINVTLRSIMDNMDALNPIKLKEFRDALKITSSIINGTKNKSSKNELEVLLDD